MQTFLQCWKHPVSRTRRHPLVRNCFYSATKLQENSAWVTGRGPRVLFRLPGMSATTKTRLRVVGHRPLLCILRLFKTLGATRLSRRKVRGRRRKGGGAYQAPFLVEASCWLLREAPAYTDGFTLAARHFAHVKNVVARHTAGRAPKFSPSDAIARSTRYGAVVAFPAQGVHGTLCVASQAIVYLSMLRRLLVGDPFPRLYAPSDMFQVVSIGPKHARKCSLPPSHPPTPPYFLLPPTCWQHCDKHAQSRLWATVACVPWHLPFKMPYVPMCTAHLSPSQHLLCTMDITADHPLQTMSFYSSSNGFRQRCWSVAAAK